MLSGDDEGRGQTCHCSRPPAPGETHSPTCTYRRSEERAGRGWTPRRVILAGNYRQAKDYVREHGWNERECVIVGTPQALRGLRGPVDVHVTGTYYEDRSVAFLAEVGMNLDVIQAISKVRTNPTADASRQTPPEADR